MKYRFMPALLALCLLLTGCSMLERDYRTVEPHSYSYREEEDKSALRTSTYQDLVNTILLLAEEHQETGRIHYYEENDFAIWSTMCNARREVLLETPAGAYALDSFTWTISSQRGYYEIDLDLEYRRTAEEEDAIIDASSSNAVYDLIPFALEENRRCLAVRFAHLEQSPSELISSILALQFPEETTDPAPTPVINPEADNAIPGEEDDPVNTPSEEPSADGDTDSEGTPPDGEHVPPVEDDPGEDDKDEPPVVLPTEPPWEVHLYPNNENAGIVEIFFW